MFSTSVVVLALFGELSVPGVLTNRLEWTRHPLLTHLIDVYKTLFFSVIGYGHFPIKQHSLPPQPLYKNPTQK